MAGGGSTGAAGESGPVMAAEMVMAAEIRMGHGSDGEHGAMTTEIPAINYKPGMRVRVTQHIAFRRQSTEAVVEGRLVRFGQQKTGSWFAHAKDDKLWLDRLELVKDDGEVVVVNLDQFSRVEVIG